MWKQDVKKIAMLTVGAGGALALYKYNSRQKQLTLSFFVLQCNAMNLILSISLGVAWCRMRPGRCLLVLI